MMERFDQACLMGILNITPDSFSDGGEYYGQLEKALAHATAMSRQGAGIIDVGGESTRPGSQRVSAHEQKQRVIEVISKISKQLPEVLISIDTTLSEVAAAALDAGAGMLNDISAGRDDPEILRLAADKQVPICLMHMQGDPETMQNAPQYRDVVAEVCQFLDERVELALRAGVNERQIILDPGIGFGKTSEHNLALIAHLQRIVDMGFPVLLGVSRKRFISSVCSVSKPADKIIASCMVAMFGLLAGVRILRVHDIHEHRQMMEMVHAVQNV